MVVVSATANWVWLRTVMAAVDVRLLRSMATAASDEITAVLVAGVLSAAIRRIVTRNVMAGIAVPGTIGPSLNSSLGPVSPLSPVHGMPSAPLSAATSSTGIDADSGTYRAQAGSVSVTVTPGTGPVDGVFRVTAGETVYV